MKKNIAVLLCGSGYLDGTEIREAVATLWALSTLSAEATCFSPEGSQVDVVDHSSKEKLRETRYMEKESARIARSTPKMLSNLKSSHFDGLIIPGGFGVAKNLCNFAEKGENAKLKEEVLPVIQDFHAAKKPVLAICIAPILLALALKKEAPLTLSLGAESETSRIIETWGHKHLVKKVNEFVVDEKNKIVTTPAYMYENPKLADLFEGVRGATKALLELS